MKRAVLTIKGRVQRVGYRDAVEELARQLQIAGFVENLKPYDVRIVAEGEDQAIEQFIEQVQIMKSPIKVERLEVRFEEFTGEFAYFEIKRGDMAEELGERLDLANARMTEMKQQQDIMIEKQDKMLEKQDMMLGKQDQMLQKQDETTGELRALRGDLKSFMEERFARLEREIGEIKVRLAMA
jgi:acylphosphatase